MPCYSAWSDYLTPGTPDYDRAETEVKAKLKAIQHAVDYYYAVAGLGTPPPAEAAPEDEHVLDRLTHHLACDGVSFSTLYDVMGVEPLGTGYLRVLRACAFRLRAGISAPTGMDHDNDRPFLQLQAGLHYGAEFFTSAGHRESAALLVHRVQAMRTGRNELQLQFAKTGRLGGTEAHDQTFRVLDRSEKLVVLRPVTPSHWHVVIATQLSWEWLGRELGVFPRHGGDDAQTRMADRSRASQ